MESGIELDDASPGIAKTAPGSKRLSACGGSLKVEIVEIVSIFEYSGINARFPKFAEFCRHLHESEYFVKFYLAYWWIMALLYAVDMLQAMLLWALSAFSIFSPLFFLFTGFVDNRKALLILDLKILLQVVLVLLGTISLIFLGLHSGNDSYACALLVLMMTAPTAFVLQFPIYGGPARTMVYVMLSVEPVVITYSCALQSFWRFHSSRPCSWPCCGTTSSAHRRA